MKLTGNLKKQVVKAGNKEEARGLIKKAGMLLTDDELNMVAGGQGERWPDPPILCEDCGAALEFGVFCPNCDSLWDE